MRARLASLVLAGTLLLSGCTAAPTAEPPDACAAAEALNAVPASDADAVEEALAALAERLPDEVAFAGEALVAGETEVAGTPALDILRHWAFNECRVTLTLGASAGQLDEAAARLADFEVTTGRTGDRTDITVVGVPGELSALAVCQEALDDAPTSSDVYVWVRDVFGVAIVAGSSTETCRVIPGSLPGR